MEAISLMLRVLSPAEIAKYVPDERYRTLRTLWNQPKSGVQADDPDSPSELIVFRIEFRNTSECPVSLNFDNASCKAELLGLRVYDAAGKKIEPVRNVHIRMKPGSRSSHTLPPGGTCDADLVGEIIGDWLIFPGAKYCISHSSVLSASFSFQNEESNTVQLQLSRALA